ncbi:MULTISPECIES: flagellar protein [unclassified Butyrivibrio]|uniref:flagellar protein n=1 Tax=unclassified Butyrivibrio TaxID=2639466 RepID=UPI00041EB3AE|nr:MULTISPECIES: flagellar protein [unclassified Butyrivibrio]
MSNVRNCSRCGKMFNYIAGDVLCENCKKSIEEKFQQVKKYIQDNPGSGLKQISDECEVSTKQLKKWILEERLMFTEQSPIQITCENCGERIQTGRLCAKCKATVTNALSDTVKKRQEALAAEIAKKQAAQKSDQKSGMKFLRT